MYEAISNHATSWRRHAAVAVAATVFAAGGAAPSLAADDDAAARDLTVEQTAIFTVQALAPAAASPGALNVVAWVDHADNTYAIGEAVGLFVRASKDAYLTVLNVGPSGNTTMLFPNAFQKDARVRANQVVRIPAPGAGTSITVSGPVGRELIKVIASTSPAPLFQAAKLTGAGLFAMLDGGSRSVARDLQVTMDAQTNHEWDDYNKVITTIASRPVAAAPLMPAPSGVAWPAMGSTLRIATDKSQYRLGEPVSVYVSSAAPCYLTLVSIGSSGQARVLLPNAMQPQNLLPAIQTVVFPGAGSNLKVTPIGPPGVETVTAICSADNRPVVVGDLVYGRDGYASLAVVDASSSRDLAVVATNPARQAMHATIGFLVTQ